MKKIFATALLLLSSPAFAADCITNGFNEKVCVGDITHPLKQTIVKIERQRNLIVVRESNGGLTAYDADIVRVQPKERMGYRVGQVISNQNMILQVTNVTYSAQFHPELNIDVPDFKMTETLWRALPKTSSPITAAISLKTAKAEAYTFLLRNKLEGRRVHVSEVDTVEAALTGGDAVVRVSTIPFEVKVVAIDPARPVITVEYKLNGETLKAVMYKSELDLFGSAADSSQFMDGCTQINTCADTLHWGG